MNMLDSLSVDVLQFYVPNLNYIYHVYLYHDFSPPPSVWRRTGDNHRKFHLFLGFSYHPPPVPGGGRALQHEMELQ